MKYTACRCGHLAVAVGAPGSQARREVESRTCARPRCRSELPAKFSDDECEAYCRLWDAGFSFTVDLLGKGVQIRTRGGAVESFPSLVGALEVLT